MIGETLAELWWDTPAGREFSPESALSVVTEAGCFRLSWPRVTPTIQRVARSKGKRVHLNSSYRQHHIVDLYCGEWRPFHYDMVLLLDNGHAVLFGYVTFEGAFLMHSLVEPDQVPTRKDIAEYIQIKMECE